MKRLISLKNVTIFIIILSSPVIWTLIFNSSFIVKDWGEAWGNLLNKLEYFGSPEAINPILYVRHANTDSQGIVFLYSKLFYNKLTFFIGESFSFLAFFSPRFYFQAGDGTIFSPNMVEPIAFLLFPFWFYGLVLSVRKKSWRPIFLLVTITFFAYLFGKRIFSFLWPTLPFHFHFIIRGILPFLSSKVVKLYLSLVIIYSLFILGRLFVL